MTGEGWATLVVGPVVPADAELVADLLWAAGASAVEERPEGAGTLLVSDAEPAPAAALLGDRWPSQVVEVDGSWRDAWRAWASSVRVDQGFVVHLPWAERVDREGDVVLVLDPGHAFGSGAHPTTLGCLRLLRRLQAGGALGGAGVLDVGCGSGVLCVAAALLGAARARGIDVDPAALPATVANAAGNGVAVAVEVGLEPLAAEPSASYEVVLANIGARVLLELADDLVRVVRPGGALVLSGLLDAQVERTAARFAGAGLRVEAVEPLDGWSSLLLRASR